MWLVYRGIQEYLDVDRRMAVRSVDDLPSIWMKGRGEGCTSEVGYLLLLKYVYVNLTSVVIVPHPWNK